MATAPLPSGCPPTARVERVFALTSTWYWVRRCLENLLAVAETRAAPAPIHAFLEKQVLYVMSQRPVRFYRFGESERLRLKDIVTDDGRLDRSRFDRVVYTNKRGVAHNAMSQAEIGVWLIDARRRLGERGLLPEAAAEYEALGIAAFRVILDPVTDGELKSGGPCDLRPELGCAWYHAVTDPTRNSSTEGATLNKHLLVIKDLEIAALTLAEIDSADPSETRGNTARQFHDAADEGIFQLVYASGHRAAGLAPNLLDYVARDAAGAPIARSWLYYGLNPEKARGGYFLKADNFKNCHYHIIDMSFLSEVFASAGRDVDLGAFTEFREELGTSLLGFILQAYEQKVAEGLMDDSPTLEGGNYAGCKTEPFGAARIASIVDTLTGMLPPRP